MSSRRPSVLWLVWLSVTAGCDPRLALVDSAVITCAQQNDCPGDLICVRDVGRCSPRGSPCTEERGDGVYAASDGNTCVRDDGEGTCRQGACTRCGDGRTENGEECDDGNDDSEDGCTIRCEIAVCGDSRLTSPPEACDDGNDNDNDGCAACRRVEWDAQLAYGIGARRSELPALSLPKVTAIAVGRSGLVYVATQAEDVVGAISVTSGTLWSISEASQVIVRVAGLETAGPLVPLRETQSARGVPLPPITGIAFGERDVIYLSLSGLGLAHIVAIEDGTMRIIAGTGEICTAATNDACGDDAPARIARLRDPGPLAFDGGGELYFADGPGIRVIARDGTLRTFAGGGVTCTSGACGDGDPPFEASFGRITGLAFDVGNNLYVTDAGQNRLRRIGRGVAGGRPPAVERLRDVDAASAVATVGNQIYYASGVDGAGVKIYDAAGDRPFLGNGIACADTPCGDAGPGGDAEVRNVVALAPAIDGAVLVADAGLASVRRVADGIVRGVAGGRPPSIVSGALATSRGIGATAIAPLPAGDLAIASSDLVFRYRATTGTLEHIGGAGSICRGVKCRAEGDALTVGFEAIADIATFGETILIADAGSRRVLELAEGTVRIVAGSGDACATEPCADVADARTLPLTAPRGLTVDANGIYIASNHTVWRVDRNSGAATRVAGSTSGYSDNADARNALFACALDVAVADDGALLVADLENCALRRIDAAGVTTLIRDDTSTCDALAFEPNCQGLFTPTCTGMLLPTSIEAHGDLLTLANACENIVEDLTLSAPTLRTRRAGGSLSALEGSLATDLLINQPRFTHDSGDRLVVMDTAVSASRVWRVDGTTARTTTIVGDVDGGITGPPSVVELGPIVGATTTSPGIAFLLDAGYGVVRRTTGGERVETVIGHRYGVVPEPLSESEPPSAPSRVWQPMAQVGGVTFAPETSSLIVSDGSALLITNIDGNDAGLWRTLFIPVNDQTSVNVALGAVAAAPGGNAVYATDRERPVVYSVATEGDYLLIYGQASIIAGRDGFVGSDGDGGQALDAALDKPSALAVSRSGALYIADIGSHRVRRIDTNGVITTVLGTGLASNADGAPAAAMPVDSPSGLVFDAFDNLVVTGRDSVRLVFTDSGQCGEPCGDSSVETIYTSAASPAQRDLATCLSAPFLGPTPDTIDVGDACSGAVLRLTRRNPN